ncbi:hypothetical protein RHGRI_007368 [Rhododendron griersonianum]|uniref:Uncharacterized protein n=1 Tax=Rhododendron griersonianum TaxID=479676 RepID=A0AAV6KWJ7_9ERIC|nr:hypothetical protein RHGRI_007368 [Rhododendron griersonianum]
MSFHLLLTILTHHYELPSPLQKSILSSSSTVIHPKRRTYPLFVIHSRPRNRFWNPSSALLRDSYDFKCPNFDDTGNGNCCTLPVCENVYAGEASGSMDVPEKVDVSNIAFQQDEPTEGIPILAGDTNSSYNKDDVDPEIVSDDELMEDHIDDNNDGDDTLAEYVDDEEDELNRQPDFDIDLDIDCAI